MKLMNKLTSIAVAAGLCLTMNQATAQTQAASISDLLDLVAADTLTQTDAQRQREIDFQNNVNQRQQMVNDIEQREREEVSESDRLDQIWNENEVLIAQRFETLQERKGDLDELFGTISGVVGDTTAVFENSLISAQYPGREVFLSDLAEVLTSESNLPTSEELNTLAFYLLQEIAESGNIVKFEAQVSQPGGEMGTQEVVRLGTYNIVSEGNYLSYNPTTQGLSILAKQPADYTGTAADLQASTSGVTKMGIDPTGATGGSYLAALISYPSMRERIDEGRQIGYIILFFGVVAVLFALERIITLTIIGTKVRSQLKNPSNPNKNNPLGRVLMVYNEHENADVETVELKLGEAIMKETPKLERFLTLLKIIATVAPLGGLLGTVTGMITVFQAITVFGTGDPQVMASGISGALVTTVEGLVVAIPTVLLHTFVKGRSDRIIHILEEQATGMIARRAENA